MAKQFTLKQVVDSPRPWTQVFAIYRGYSAGFNGVAQYVGSVLRVNG